jgi:hypothetical protein
MNDHSHLKRELGFQSLKYLKDLDLKQESEKINSEFSIDRIKAFKFVVLQVLNSPGLVTEIIKLLKQQLMAVQQDFLNTVRGYPMHGYLLVILDLLDYDSCKDLILSTDLYTDLTDIVELCLDYFSKNEIQSVNSDLKLPIVFCTDSKKEFRTLSDQEKIKNAFWRSLTTSLKILEKVVFLNSQYRVEKVVDLVIKVLLNVIHSGVIKEAQETLKILIKLENQTRIKALISLILQEIVTVKFRRFDVKSDGICRVFLQLLESVDSVNRNLVIKKTMELFQKNQNSVLQILTFLVLHFSGKDLPVFEILQFSLNIIDLQEFRFSGTLYQLILRALTLFIKSESSDCPCTTGLRSQISEILQNFDLNPQLSIIILQFLSTVPKHSCLFQQYYQDIHDGSRHYYFVQV